MSTITDGASLGTATEIEPLISCEAAAKIPLTSVANPWQMRAERRGPAYDDGISLVNSYDEREER